MTRVSLILQILLIAVLVTSFESGAKFRSQNNYKGVTIGAQVWMAENLDTEQFLNGDTIPQIKTTKDWKDAGLSGQPAWCYYNNDSVIGKNYGKLYNFHAVNDPRGLAPKGWHIPDNKEWEQLIKFLGRSEFAGQKMKSDSGWHKNRNGSNTFGFDARPSGFRDAESLFGRFIAINKLASWWSLSQMPLPSRLAKRRKSFEAFAYLLVHNRNSIERDTHFMLDGLSVRCVKD